MNNATIIYTFDSDDSNIKSWQTLHLESEIMIKILIVANYGFFTVTIISFACLQFYKHSWLNIFKPSILVQMVLYSNRLLSSIPKDIYCFYLHLHL